MRFGMFYVLECPDGDYQRAYKEMFGQIEYAEELGFDSVWLAEHHGSAYGSMPSPQVAMASIAKITERMRIGLAVSILPFDNPVRVAEDFAMIDVISNGRLDLGVGRGYQPREFKMLGLADRQQYSREIFEEELDILVGLWENDSFSYNGKYFQLEDVSITPRPVQKPRPPLYVAAISPATFHLVRKYDMNVLVTPTLMSLDELKTFVLEAKKELVELGHDPLELNFPMNWQMHLAETEEEALTRPSEALDWYFNLVMKLVPKGPTAPKGYEYMANLAEAFEQGGGVSINDLRAAGIILLDTPEKVAAKIEEVRTEIGQQEIFCWMRIGGLEDEKVRASMKLFAEEVMPQFKGQEPVVPEALKALAAKA
jgi:alkanesulfonate monooxygenase SsuD/methylene tetrahydromethanopterin reductase-like flavin-dependent oxidoreductase (luciferase family)